MSATRIFYRSALAVAALFSSGSSFALTTVSLVQNPGFETGRGPSGEVDVPGGTKNGGCWRPGVYDFVPGTDVPCRYGYFDWWWGDDAPMVTSPDPVGIGSAVGPIAGPANTIVPRSGSRMLRFKGTGDRSGKGSDTFQDVDLTPYAEYVDGGAATVNFNGWFNRVEQDSGALIGRSVVFYNAAKVQIGGYSDGEATLDTDQSTWENLDFSTPVPVGTRYARLRIYAWNQSHYFVDSLGNSHWNTPYFGTYADDVSLDLEYPTVAEVGIPNGSFEQPVQAGDGTQTAVVPTSWTLVTGNVANVVVRDPSAGEFTDPVPDGNQVLLLTSRAVGVDTGWTIEADRLVEVTLRLGRRSSIATTGTLQLRLHAGSTTGTQVFAQNITAPAAGTFANVLVRKFFLADDPAVGQPLFLVVRSTSNREIAVDQVEMVRTVVPPDSLVIANSGFELPSIPAETTSSLIPTSWTLQGAGPAGLLAPSLADYPTSAPEGLQLAFVGNGTGQIYQQVQGHTLQPNSLYILYATIGNRASSAGDPRFRMDIMTGPNTTLVGATSRAQYGGTDLSALGLADGQFQRVSLLYTTGPTPPTGNVFVRLYSRGPVGTLVDLDDVEFVRVSLP